MFASLGSLVLPELQFKQNVLQDFSRTKRDKQLASNVLKGTIVLHLVLLGQYSSLIMNAQSGLIVRRE